MEVNNNRIINQNKSVNFGVKKTDSIESFVNEIKVAHPKIKKCIENLPIIKTIKEHDTFESLIKKANNDKTILDNFYNFSINKLRGFTRLINSIGIKILENMNEFGLTISPFRITIEDDKTGEKKISNIVNAAKVKRYLKKNRDKIKFKSYKKKYYLENKEKIKLKNQKYRMENQEKLKENKQKYYLKNKEEIKAKAQKYRMENQEKIQAYRQKYYLENKEKIKLKKQKYYLENKEKIKLKKQKYYLENKEALNTNKQEDYLERIEEIKSNKPNDYLDDIEELDIFRQEDYLEHIEALDPFKLDDYKAIEALNVFRQEDYMENIEEIRQNENYNNGEEISNIFSN